MQIPSLDLKRQYQSLKSEIDASLEGFLKEQNFILGPAVEAFERDLARYCGISHAVGVSSGTDAITLSLMVAGIGSGDEVITTPFTFIATAEPVVLLGAKPVFVDVDARTFNLDPRLIEPAITAKTKAILVVHLYGQTADMQPILDLAERYGLAVIEDTAQAMGAVYGPTGQQAGTIGRLGTLSFFPSKNLGCFGDGGAVLTRDAVVAKRLRSLRIHGQSERYYHEAVGLNARLDALQAVILRVKLGSLEKWLNDRRERAATYARLLEAKGLLDWVEPPFVEHGNTHTYHQYTVKVRRGRDALMEHLQKAGVEARIYYPLPLHLQVCFRDLAYRQGDYPVSEQCSREILSLPLFPELKEEEQAYVVDQIETFFKKERRGN